MLNARNIHIALLGLILGSASAYLWANYQLAGQRAAAAEEAIAVINARTAEGHPEISDAEMLALFDEALAASPNNLELMSRYANFLFNLQRFDDAVEWYRKMLALDADNARVRTDMATALYNLGRIDEALAEYERSLDADPGQVLALHNLVIAYLDAKDDVAAAQNALERIEAIDPNYGALNALRSRVEARRNPPG